MYESKTLEYVRYTENLRLALTYYQHKQILKEPMWLQQEAQGLGAVLDKMEDNDHIKLDNIEI